MISNQIFKTFWCLINRPNNREIYKLQKFFDFLTFICNFLKPYPGDKFPDPRMQASGPLVGYLNILYPNPGSKPPGPPYGI